MGEINSFPIFTKTVLELDDLSGSSTSYLDSDLIYDESVGVWKKQSINERRKVLATIYPTVASLEAADLAYDIDIPVYVQVEENDYTLYKIINTAPEPSDILLNNGNVARPQPGTNSLTVNTRLNIFDKNPRVGDVVTTKGCDAIADGGHGTFDIVASTSLPVDDYSVIGSGPFAILRLTNTECNILQFGATPGDVKAYAAANAAAIQRAVDFVRRAYGGGTVRVPTGVFQVDTTILVWERVRLVGNNGTALNFWYNGTYTAAGSVLKLANGSDTDVVKVCLSIHQVSNPFPDETNTDRRTMAAVTNLAIDGNRSKTYAHTNKDLNATGNGLVIEGANLVEVHDVIITRCADDGFVTKSAGAPDSQCNNIYLHRIYSCANGGKGFSLSGGDSQIGFLWAGGNGANGITSSMGNSVLTNITANDNLGHGIYHAADDSTLSDLMCYDNHLNGCVVAGKNTQVGGKFRHNGRDTGAASTDRCGLVITNAATNSVVLAGSAFYDDGFRGDAGDIKQQYGLRVLNSGISVSVGETHAFGNAVSNYSIQDSSLLVLHEGIGSSASHPGFTSSGNINLNGFNLHNASGLSFNTPTTITSVTSNVLALAAKTLVTLNISGGATVNSITDTFTGLGRVCIRNINASSVTFTAGTSIRTKSGTDLVLAQNRGVTLQEFSDGVWYEV